LNIKDKYISKKCIEIEGLIKDSEDWAKGDAELGAHLATYINVLILGIFEECIEYLVIERSKKPGDIEIENYISKDIAQRLKNPDYGKICGVLGQFSDRYKAEFQREFSSNCSEVDALDSIIRNKTNVAHYGLANLGLSVKDVGIYFESVEKMLEKLEDLLIINP
jgi:hypothetical protein